MRKNILPLLAMSALVALAGCDPTPSSPPKPKASMSAPSMGSAPTTPELRSQAATGSVAAGSEQQAPASTEDKEKQGTSSQTARVVGPTDGAGEKPQ